MKKALLLILLPFFWLSSGFSQESEGDDAPKSIFDPWTGNVDLGGNYLQGNSDLLHLFGGFEVQRKIDESTFIFGVDGAYGRSDGIKDKEWVHAKTQYKYDFNHPFYGGLQTDFWHDDIADLRYRVSVNPLLGIYLIKNERATLALESGPSYVWEEQAGVRDGYLALRFAEKFDYRITSRSKIWQSAEYTPEISDFGNYQLVGEAGVQTWISPVVSIKAFVQNRYDSNPEGGLVDNDLGFYFALSYGVEQPKKFSADEVKAELKSCATDTWRFAGTLGASVLSGNTESSVLSAALDGMRRWDGQEAGLGIAGSYSDSQDVVTAEQIGSYAFYNYDLEKNWYFGSRIDYLHDRVADIDYRFNVGPHIGYRVIDFDDTHLKLEVGPGFAYEKQGGIQNSFATVRAGQYFDHMLFPAVKIFQSSEYFGSLEDGDDYYLVNKAGFDATICNNWAWSNTLVYKYDNIPAANLKESDLSVQSGLKWSF